MCIRDRLGAGTVPSGLLLSSNKELFRITAIAGFVLIYLGRRVFKSGAQYDDSSLDSIILYLRPFSKDEGIFSSLYFLVSNFGVYETKEESLSRLLEQVYPFVAIGRPGERLPTLGARRVYYENDEWRDNVVRHMIAAKLVILRMGDSDGFWWEVERLVENVDPLKIVFYYPDNTFWIFGKKRRITEYKILREKLIAYIPHQIPIYEKMDELIIFDDEWRSTSRVVIAQGFWNYFRGWMAGSELPHLREALRPMFHRLKVSYPKNPLAPIEYVTIPLALAVCVALVVIVPFLIHGIATEGW